MIKRSILINLVVTIVLSIQAFLINQAFGKYLGGDELGLMKLFSQLVAYLSLAELGLGAASSYALFKPLLEKDKYRVSVIISTISELYRYVSIGIVFVGVIIAFFFPLLLSKNDLGGVVYAYWAIYVVSIAANYTFSKYQILFIADQGFDFVRITQGACKFIMQSLQLYFIINTQNFLYFSMLLFVDAGLQYIIFKYRFSKDYTYIQPVSEREPKIRSDIFKLLWHKIGTLVVFNTDYIIISSFLGLNVVAVYASYLMVFQMLKTIFSVFSNVLGPKVGRLIAKGDKEITYNVWRQLNALFFVASVVVLLCTHSLINDFIKLWMGEGFVLPEWIVLLMLTNVYFDLTRNVIGMFKINSGFFDDTHLPVIESAINIVVSLFLVQKIGLAGVVIGTLMSNLVVVYIWSPILVFKRCFNLSAFSYLNVITPKIIIFIMVVIFYEIISFDFKVNSWQDWILAAGEVLIITASLSITLFLCDRDFRHAAKFRMRSVFD